MRNMEKLQTLLDRLELDGIYLTSRVNRLYAAEWDIAEGGLLLTRRGAQYWTDSRYIEAAARQLQSCQVVETTRTHSQMDCLADAVRELGIRRLGVELEALTALEYGRLRGAFPEVELAACDGGLLEFRAAKEDWELARMERAQAITDAAFADLLPVIRAGMTEKELAAELIYRLYRFGADGLSFDPIVVSGPNTSMPHGVPSDRPLQTGDFITMDFGCLYQGYCSDMTRTVALGSVTEEMRRVYDLVLEAQLAGIAATRAGVEGQVIDGAARAVIEDGGYGPQFGHGYGHGLGLEIHENPSCNTAGKTPMPLHAVCSAEPGIYLPGRFGVRIEDVVVFEQDGCRILTKSPKSLLIL